MAAFACLMEETCSFLFSTEEEEAENKGEEGVLGKRRGGIQNTGRVISRRHQEERMEEFLCDVRDFSWR